ncbi:MAG TPA: hypothetical protein VKW76_13635 [Candidatus Binatia bacterium]|nr:hypothetical protein [Candidatus Binatia bacterium]
MTRETSDWPVAIHHCDGRGVVMLRFKGAARDGSRVACPHCATLIVYRKPRAAGRGQEQGPRSHF